MNKNAVQFTGTLLPPSASSYRLLPKIPKGLSFGSGWVLWYSDKRINTSPEKLGLSFGLSFQAVRSLLVGWKDHPARAAQSVDRSKYYAVWDFTPPEGSDAPPLRLTFENEKLILWGEPSKTR